MNDMIREDVDFDTQESVLSFVENLSQQFERDARRYNRGFFEQQEVSIN